jgi:hypothetical protein
MKTARASVLAVCFDDILNLRITDNIKACRLNFLDPFARRFIYYSFTPGTHNTSRMALLHKNRTLKILDAAAAGKYGVLAAIA